MIDSLLIANRGEIARRIARTARRLGIRTVAVYSGVDAALPFVREADEAVAIGSYLDKVAIIAAAQTSGAAAIHPGYGFLSENADFAAAVLAAGLVWVGPSPAAIRAMGLKHLAKKTMQAAGVPVVPGYIGDDQTPHRLQAEADAIGYPVLIKPVAGGGGKAMHMVAEQSGFADALAASRREAAALFDDDRVLIEKYIARPRHIEVQVFGDNHGHIVHLFERDCSLQRRYQKIIEEAPAPGMDPATRELICSAAKTAARAVDYIGAGTVEFIADGSEGLRPDRIWFIEMNTRLQVEHPVTEAITGEDLVEWQLRVASGEPLPKVQGEIILSGHAIEARLYAEDPTNNFLPSTGRLARLRLPGGIRIDSGVEEGNEITPFYDPMIAKLVAHAPNRRQAAEQLAAACGKVETWPVQTNAGFLMRTASDAAFVAGAIDTAFVEQHGARLIPPTEPDEMTIKAAARSLIAAPASDPWTALAGFRVNAPPHLQVRIAIGAKIYDTAVDLLETFSDMDIACIEGVSVLFSQGRAWAFNAPSLDLASSGAASDGTILSPMPGRIVALEVVEAQSVKQGSRLLAIEAMKMEQWLVAPFDGLVRDLSAQIGAQVAEGTRLLRIEKTVAGAVPE